MVLPFPQMLGRYAQVSYFFFQQGHTGGMAVVMPVLVIRPQLCETGFLVCNLPGVCINHRIIDHRYHLGKTKAPTREGWMLLRLSACYEKEGLRMPLVLNLSIIQCTTGGV